jgi:hypothetical protein
VVKVLTALASLRLTVVLFVLALVLVFCGTLAQREAGVWTVVNQYFRSFFVWVPFRIFLPAQSSFPGSFPFPGGWLIGSLLLLNLLAAHLVRFKLSWKRSGILVLHAGLVVMMVSEVIAGHFGVEGIMTIPLNASSNYIEEQEKVELAVVSPADAKTDDVVVVPGPVLRKGGVIHNDLLPFDVRVDRYMPNSSFARVTPGADNLATVGEGLRFAASDRAEGNGVEPEQQVDLPSAYLTFLTKDTGESLGTYMVSAWFPALEVPVPPQKVTAGGKTYDVELRFKRIYKPYSVQLFKFTHDVYTGTDIPKDFRSQVRLQDPSRNTEREVEIYMNHPLRYGGETFYQAGYLPGDAGTKLQVVRNPGWVLPYVSCAMVAAGMLFHFGLTLVGFLRRVSS